MEMLELLKEHPKSAIVIKQWFLEKMLESMKDQSVPEDFKNSIREAGIDNERVAGVINSAPRALFDVFDSHKIYVEITVDQAGGFWWNIGETKSTSSYEYRINADKSAILEAFKLLEAKL